MMHRDDSKISEDNKIYEKGGVYLLHAPLPWMYAGR